MTELGIRIQKQLDKLKKTQKQLSKEIGVTEVTISRYINGAREPKGEIISKIANSLYTTTDYLLGKNDYSYVLPEGAVELDNFVKLPVLGVIRAGEPLFAEQNIIGYEYLATNNLPKGELFCFKVVGDSMNLSNIVEGSLVVIRVQEEVKNGEIAVVIVNGEDGTVKKYYRNENMVTLMPHSSNQDNMPRIINTKDVPVKVVGKIVQAVIKF